jgi:rare lipoprotein A (peptidoglycan hydrolase)
VVVRINDRARHGIPFVIDLSRGSARAIGIDRKVGIAPVALYTAN